MIGGADDESISFLDLEKSENSRGYFEYYRADRLFAA